MIAQVVVARWAWECATSARIVRVKRQRDEGNEAVGFVLQLAQFQQVIDALFFGFHVAVEHGGVGAQADFVRLCARC